MKRIILLLFMTLVLFAFAILRLCEPKETWLRIEQNGLYFETDYLHRLREKNRAELNKYLGGYISFVLPLDAIFDNADTDSFGEIEKLMIFRLEDGKTFLVDCGNNDVGAYKTGDMLYVKGKLTAAYGERVYILNAYGCPGWPNDITIKAISQS